MDRHLTAQAKQTDMTERTRHRRVSTPATDIYETDDAVILLANMPGVEEKNINITLEQDVLTLEGIQEERPRPGYALTYEEFDTCDYRRVFTLSSHVERDGIEATLRDGVLKLVLPKSEPSKVRKIAVKRD